MEAGGQDDILNVQWDPPLVEQGGNVPQGGQEREEQPRSPCVPRLEDLSLDALMIYLETECVAMIELSQSGSKLLDGVAKNIAKGLKTQLRERMSGVASSYIREKMMKRILSQEIPSSRRCEKEIRQRKDEATGDDQMDPLLAEIEGGNSIYSHSNCINICCTGAHIQEAMAGIVV